MRDVDRFLVTVDEVVVACDIGAVIADVAEERAERSVVVERQRQGAHRPGRHLHADTHVHGDTELGVHRPLHRLHLARDLTGLVLEQIDRMTGVVPEQVIGPAPRLAFGVQVAAAEKESLHVQVLQRQLARLDLSVNPLMTGIEAPRVSNHGNQPGLFLHGNHALRIRKRLGHRDLNLDVFAGAHHLDRLFRVNRCRRRQDCCVSPLEPFVQV